MSDARPVEAVLDAWIVESDERPGEDVSAFVLGLRPVDPLPPHPA